MITQYNSIAIPFRHVIPAVGTHEVMVAFNPMVVTTRPATAGGEYFRHEFPFRKAWLKLSQRSAQGKIQFQECKKTIAILGLPYQLRSLVTSYIRSERA